MEKDQTTLSSCLNCFPPIVLPCCVAWPLHALALVAAAPLHGRKHGCRPPRHALACSTPLSRGFALAAAASERLRRRATHSIAQLPRTGWPGRASRLRGRRCAPRRIAFVHSCLAGAAPQLRHGCDWRALASLRVYTAHSPGAPAIARPDIVRLSPRPTAHCPCCWFD